MNTHCVLIHYSNERHSSTLRVGGGGGLVFEQESTFRWINNTSEHWKTDGLHSQGNPNIWKGFCTRGEPWLLSGGQLTPRQRHKCYRDIKNTDFHSNVTSQQFAQAFHIQLKEKPSTPFACDRKTNTKVQRQLNVQIFLVLITKLQWDFGGGVVPTIGVQIGPDGGRRRLLKRMQNKRLVLPECRSSPSAEVPNHRAADRYVGHLVPGLIWFFFLLWNKVFFLKLTGFSPNYVSSSRLTFFPKRQQVNENRLWFLLHESLDNP